MTLYQDKASCCGCGACVDACPCGAIRMAEDGEGFLYPRLQEAACTGCGHCEAVCPLKGEGPAASENAYFGAQADKLRPASSSGGVFPVLAEYILARGGAVFGAAFDAGMALIHQETKSRAGLDELRKTKYVQSRMDGIYRRVKALLEEGKWVLFCGTPCQAQALRRFLGGPYPRLLLADLICYGVPSPGIWREYVKFLERRHGGKMTAFSFRDKRRRDNGHTCSYRVGDREYAGPLESDTFCGLYFSNLILRPSCHACRFCTPYRESDLTLGDFWGVEKVHPQADDGMGTSLVILHSEKAREIWREASAGLRCFACGEGEVLQPRLQLPTRQGLGAPLIKRLPRSLLFLLFPLGRRAIGAIRRWIGGRGR